MMKDVLLIWTAVKQLDASKADRKELENLGLEVTSKNAVSLTQSVPRRQDLNLLRGGVAPRHCCGCRRLLLTKFLQTLSGNLQKLQDYNTAQVRLKKGTIHFPLLSRLLRELFELSFRNNLLALPEDLHHLCKSRLPTHLNLVAKKRMQLRRILP